MCKLWTYVLPYSCGCLIITVHSEPRMIATTKKGSRHVHTVCTYILYYYMVGPITYVFEQCAKLLPIKPKLCSVGSHYVHMVNITTNLIHSCMVKLLAEKCMHACMHGLQQKMVPPICMQKWSLWTDFGRKLAKNVSDTSHNKNCIDYHENFKGIITLIIATISIIARP